MKKALIFFTVLFFNKAFSQSQQGAIILQLSKQIFKWEVEINTDSLSNLFDEKLSIVNSHGDIQNKQQYLATLKNGAFKHDSIDVEQSTANIKDKTATVVGKGRFVMTLDGNKLHRHLSYMEVFIKEENHWKLFALYASALPD